MTSVNEYGDQVAFKKMEKLNGMERQKIHSSKIKILEIL